MWILKLIDMIIDYLLTVCGMPPQEDPAPGTSPDCPPESTPTPETEPPS